VTLLLIGCASPDEQDKDSGPAPAPDSGTETEDTGSSTGNAFLDAFDALDPKVWGTANWTLGDTELSEAGVSVDDGALLLSHAWGDDAWSGGEIYSEAAFFYGTWTARIAAPTQTGTVCAFFFYDAVSNGDSYIVNEIDFEILDGRVLVGTYAQWRPEDGYEKGPTRDYTWWTPEADFELSEFHEYGLTWTSEQITFFVDGETIAQTTVVPKDDLPVRFNHWTSSTWPEVGTPPAGETLTCRVDHVEASGFLTSSDLDPAD
jgi:beta-glucanase (GH16 family)